MIIAFFLSFWSLRSHHSILCLIQEQWFMEQSLSWFYFLLSTTVAAEGGQTAHEDHHGWHGGRTTAREDASREIGQVVGAPKQRGRDSLFIPNLNAEFHTLKKRRSSIGSNTQTRRSSIVHIFRLSKTYLLKLNNKSTAIASKLHDNFKQYTGPPSYLQIYFIVILDMYLVLHTTYICIDHLYK